MRLPEINIKHRNLLIIASVVTKISIFFFTVYICGKFFDMYDFGMYYKAVINVVHGALPWTSGVIFYYPPLSLLPMTIAFMVSLIGGSFGFILTMWGLMIACDIVTTLCVYYIGLKLYSEHVAFVAAMLNATAISSAYFILTRFDAFPTCLVMLALLTAVYGDKLKGYLLTIGGLFTKVWPVLIYPFLWLYHGRDSSVIEEGKKGAFWILVAGIAAFVLMIVIGYNKFLGYADIVYCNTLPYGVWQYLQVLGISTPFWIISDIFRAATLVIFFGSIYYFYKQPKTVVLLLKVILLTLVATIFFSQYRSPQYIVWFTPLAAVLIADDLWGIVIFIGVQILAFMEFPLAFYILYVNDHYTSPLALGFFSVLFIAYGLLLWKALKKSDKLVDTDNTITKKEAK
jgi:hypothetical protein